MWDVTVSGEQDKESKQFLSETFKSAAATDAHNKEVAALMGEIDPDNPEILPGGVRSVLGLTDAKIEQIKKKKRNRDFFEFLFREAIRKAVANLNDIIEFHEKCLAELLEQMDKANRTLEELDRQHDILESELEYFKDMGLFDLDENGRLKNKEAEAIIAAWEEKTGETIDRSDPAAYETIFGILVEIEEQRIQLKRNLNDYTAEYEYHKEKRDDAIQIRDDLKSGDPVRTRNAFQKYANHFSGLEDVPKNPSVKKIESLADNNEDLENLEIPPEYMDEDFSFGFPPLQENFGQAVTDQAQSSQSSHHKSEVTKTKPLSINIVGQ